MKNIKILIVEDEAILAMNYKIGLEKAHFIVTGIAFSGEDALRQAEETRPDLVLMDIKLRGPMDGIDAALKIREAMDPKVIFLTGNSDEDTRKRAMEISPLRYIEKPVKTDILSGIIQSVMA